MLKLTLIRTSSEKIAVFTYRSPHFCFPWRCPCDYHSICSMDGKIIQCLSKPSQHVPIYLQQFPSYTMFKSMRKSKHRYFTTFWLPLGTPLGQSRYSFPLIRTASAKNRRLHVPQPTYLFPLETLLRLSRNMLHGWKDNSMLAKPLAACTYLSSILSELYDA